MSFLDAWRRNVKKFNETPFKQGWEFRVEFVVPANNRAASKLPRDFDIYVKGLKHGGFTIDYVSKQIGTANINTPESKSAGSIDLVLRDNKDLVVDSFLRELSKSVVNEDGTVNLPSEYLIKIRFYAPDSSGNERLAFEWQVSAETFSVDEHSYEKVSEFIHYEASFKKYRS